SLASARVNGGARIFAGTEPAHLFCSDDLGRSWSELEALRSVDTSQWFFPGPPHIAHTKHINFHPDDVNTLFIGIEVGGLIKSTDGGKTFHVITGMDPDVHRTVINPQDPNRIYITGGDGLYVTSNGGDSWEHWTTTEHEIGGYPDMLVLHPRHPELVFIAAAQYGPGSWRESHYAGTRISRSADGGRTWEPIRQGLPDRLQTAVEAMCLEDWGDSFSVYAATATGEVWGSEDGGANWSELISGLAPISKGPHYVSLATT
ncbi:MAG: glycosyl hydrolase, partial [Dehalococcoidia bacterium]